MNTKSLKVGLCTLFLGSLSFQAVGRTISEQSKFLQNYAKLGTRTVSDTPRVMDYGRLSSAKSDEVVCVYDVRCVAPKYNVDERSAVFCEYDSTMGCEDFDACVREMPKREINTRLAAGPKPTTADRCKGGPDYQFVRPTAKEEGTEAAPICVHAASCSGQTNVKQPALVPPGVVFCLSNGKTQSMQIDGETYQVPVCPSVPSCVDNALPTETHATYKQRLADARDKQERETSPRNSATMPVSKIQSRHSGLSK